MLFLPGLYFSFFPPPTVIDCTVSCSPHLTLLPKEGLQDTLPVSLDHHYKEKQGKKSHHPFNKREKGRRYILHFLAHKMMWPLSWSIQFFSHGEKHLSTIFSEKRSCVPQAPTTNLNSYQKKKEETAFQIKRHQKTPKLFYVGLETESQSVLALRHGTDDFLPLVICRFNLRIFSEITNINYSSLWNRSTDECRNKRQSPASICFCLGGLVVDAKTALKRLFQAPEGYVKMWRLGIGFKSYF